MTGEAAPEYDSPESLVRRLLDDELSSVQSEAASGRRAHVLKTLDERGTAQQLIREQYSGRYPFELLQNANDAIGARVDSEGVTGLEVRFVVTEHALIVADQGSGFGTEEIKAICGLGRSSKDPRKSVGYKGLGFKSVGEICDTPQILSNGVAFGFDPGRVRQEIERIVGPTDDHQRFPTYAFPFPLADGALGSDEGLVESLFIAGFTTVLRFPFRRGVRRDKVVDDVVGTITPQLLLFLPATERLEIQGTSRDFAAVALRETLDDHEEVLLEVDGEQDLWLVYTRRLEPPSTDMMRALGDAWSSVEAVHVRAAVRLDSAGRPDCTRCYPLSVYFPTEERTGLPMILQADFALDLDRRFVSRTPEAYEYNSWLATELGRLVGEAVAPSLAKAFPGNGQVIGVVAPRMEATDFGRHCADEVIHHLETSRFIPCVDGRIRLPGEALLLPESIRDAEIAFRYMDLAERGQLVNVFGQTDPHARRLLEDRLGVATLHDGEAVELLVPPAADELEDFYRLLLDWMDRVGPYRFAPLLAECRVVMTRSGSWRSPSEGVFFPRERGDPEVFEELPVEIAVVPDLQGARELLEHAGVRPFRWRELLIDQILPVLVDPSTTIESRGPAWRMLRAYFEAEGGGDREITQRVKEVLLPATTSAGGETVLRGAGRTYFSSEWLGHDRLTEIYGPFGQPEFLAVPQPEDPDVRDADFEFFKWLGVDDSPRIFTARTEQRDRYMWNQTSRHPHRRLDESAWTSWAASTEVHKGAQCSQGHPASQQLQVSHVMDRLSELVQRADPIQLGNLFLELGAHWGTKYAAKLHATFNCQHTGHAGQDRRRQVPSIFAHLLATLPWVPATRGDNLSLTRPRDVWRLPPDMPRRVAALLPALPPDLDVPQTVAMCADIGIVDGARPSAADLTRLLRDLAEQFEERTPPGDPDLLDTARWAIGRLNDALERDSLALENQPEVPLLAVFGGKAVFTTEPYVCDDPNLRDTWSDTVPILDAGRDYRRLRVALHLRDLSEEVEVYPDARGVDQDMSEQLTATLRRAAPFLAAAALEASPSRSETILARLPRIEVVACQELNLQYRLGDLERIRPHARSYLATRIEASGRQRRAIGTAYLELGSNDGEPPWFSFGPQLAQFVDVPAQRDAFALLLGANDETRRQYLSSRGIEMEAIENLRRELARRMTQREEDLERLITPFLGSAATAEPAKRPAGSRDPEVGPYDAPSPSRSESEEAGDDKPAAQRLEEPDQLPSIDITAVRLEEASHVKVTLDGRARRENAGGEGQPRPIDWERATKVTRAVGRWGEQLVLELERKRLLEMGFDPDAVEWRSARDESSPFDIKSLDRAGHVIFIEVKTTIQADPHLPFDISAPELLYALQHRERYYIYRVLGARSSEPRVIAYDDPIGRLLNGEGKLWLGSGKLYLASETSVCTTSESPQVQ
ncbi:MAG TPA: DUF3883 domain-containing protein [Acidobacteria bacterium]|nr:DUF3883 domain-containing protein [Acidobacteriota bacterium]